MSKDKKTEDLIREKLDGRGFPFDEKAWAGMESMLDAQEKKRRVGFFWYFSASMFIALVAGAALYYGKESSLTSQNSQVSITEAKDKKHETVSVNQNSKEVNVLQDNTNKTTAKQQNNNVTLSVVEGQNNKKAVSDKKSDQLNKQQAQATNTTKQQAKTITTTNKQGSSDNAVKDLANSPVAADKNATDLRSNNVELNNTGNGSSSVEVVNTNEVVKNENQIIEVDNQNNAESNIVAENNQVAVANEEKAAEKLSVDTAIAEAVKQNPFAAPGKETKNAWGVVAGGGVWIPYQSTSGKTNQKGMLGFTGGIYYQRALGKHFDIGISALYANRGALNYDKTYTSSEFGFGIQSDKTIVSPQTLHYLNVPLYVRFNFSQRSHFILGASYYRLLAITSKIEHITEDSFGVLTHSSDKQTGHHDGFKKYDVSAFIGYDLTLFDRMNAGLQFSYGFYDITNDNYSSYKGDDKNISLQLLLKYDLIKH